MSRVKIFWDPKGFELDSIGSKKYIRASDGDTPYISMSVRMLSIDTPELHYPGKKRPSSQDENLYKLAQWIKENRVPIDKKLGEYLYPKLVTKKAGSLQEEQGKGATNYFRALLKSGLNSSKTLYTRALDQPFDSYGRLLAYISPYHNRKKLASMSMIERSTFNLQMISAGWAVSFPIYPSLPSYRDLILLQKVAKEAYEQKRGTWSNSLMLSGYEFRMCVKLYKITKKLILNKSLSSREKNSWISRFCVDMTTREIYSPQEYYEVKPYNRVFIWAKDVSEAVGKMNLIPKQNS
jgi:endonuclease YncB( thermonuclease family)